MIVGALHQRVVAAAPGPIGIIDPPEFDGSSFSESGLSFPPDPAQSGISFWIRGDGTWLMEKRISGIGSPQSGDWAITPAAGIGDDFSVKFTMTQTVGDGSHITVTNEAPTFTVIGSGVGHKARVWMSLPTAGTDYVEFTVLIEIRNDTTMEIVSATITYLIDADNTV